MATSKAVTTIPETREIAVINALASDEAREVAAALRENFDGETLDPWKLPRIKINPGSAPAWSVNYGEGEELARSVTGIVIEMRKSRAYWSKSLDEGGAGSPPDCVSIDGSIGIGNPGGECATCPLNQFNTARGAKEGETGRGKACNETRQLFMLTEPSPIIPALVTLPATSIKAWTQFLMGRASKGSLYWKNQITLDLEPTKNAGGIAYSQLIVKKDNTIPLSTEQAAFIAKHRQDIQPLLGDARIIEQALTEDRDDLAGVS